MLLFTSTFEAVTSMPDAVGYVFVFILGGIVGSFLNVVIHRLPNLRALNIVLVGYLGEGVASSTSFDPQAKGLGEYLRSRSVPD